MQPDSPLQGEGKHTRIESKTLSESFVWCELINAQFLLKTLFNRVYKVFQFFFANKNTEALFAVKERTYSKCKVRSVERIACFNSCIMLLYSLEQRFAKILWPCEKQWRNSPGTPTENKPESVAAWWCLLTANTLRNPLLDEALIIGFDCVCSSIFFLVGRNRQWTCFQDDLSTFTCLRLFGRLVTKTNLMRFAHCKNAQQNALPMENPRILSRINLPHFEGSWLHGWSDGAPKWLKSRTAEPEQNLSYRTERSSWWILAVSNTDSAGYPASGWAYLLGLECIVSAPVVQIVTQTADHQSQNLSIRQNILKGGCLSETRGVKYTDLVSSMEKEKISEFLIWQDLFKWGGKVLDIAASH